MDLTKYPVKFQPPDNIYRATSLELTNARLPELPSSLSLLLRLNELSLQGNELSALPPSVSKLTNITLLNISDNKFTALPEVISHLTNLRSISIADNQIEDLPLWITLLKRLATLIVLGKDGKSSMKTAPVGIRSQVCFSELDAQIHPRLYAENEVILCDRQLESLEDKFESFLGCTRIDASNNKISMLPDAFSTLTELKSLSLGSSYGGNSFVELPSVLQSLTSITELFIQKLPISRIPEWITSLSNLHHLGIDAHQIREASVGLTSLPCYQGNGLLAEIPLAQFNEGFYLNRGLSTINELMHSFKCFTKIQLSGNLLTSLPDGISSVFNLKVLYLGQGSQGNQLSYLPSSFSSLSCLQHLSLDSNHFEQLPVPLSFLTSLTHLSAESNRITLVPVWINQLQRLDTLNIRKNKITVLPSEMSSLHALQRLECDYRQIIYPPQMVIERGTKAVVEYMNAVEEYGGEAWDEVRVLVFGKRLSGKSTLCASILSKPFLCFGFSSTCDPSRVSSGRLTIHEKPVSQLGSHPLGSCVLWDFDGRDIHRVIVPMHFAKSGVMVITYNMHEDKAKDSLIPWLDLVYYYCPFAPTIIVGTHADKLTASEEHAKESELAAVVAEYRSKIPIINGIRVSNHTGIGIEELRDEIVNFGRKLPLSDIHVPKYYNRVKDLIISTRRNVSYRCMLVKDLVEKCARDLTISESDASQSLRFLHDVGLVIWREEQEDMRDSIVISPEYFVDSLLTINNLKAISLENGFVEKTQYTIYLTQALGGDIRKTGSVGRGAAYPRVSEGFKYPELLIKYIGLCIELKSERKIFPLLLPTEQSNNEKWSDDQSEVVEQLIYYMTYDCHLPPIVVSKILVEVFRLICEQDPDPTDISTYFSSNLAVFKFGVDAHTGQIIAGSTFQGHLRFIESDKVSTKEEHELIKCEKIELRVRTKMMKACVRTATMALVKRFLGHIKIPVHKSGFACPICMIDQDLKKNPSLHELDSWNPQFPKFTCQHNHAIANVDYQKYLLPTTLPRSDFNGNRTHKKALSEGVLENRLVRVFLSSTFIDMRQIREGFTKITKPQIELEGLNMGIQLIFGDLRWGVTDEEAEKGQTIIHCLQEVKRSDYFVCFMGARFGWVPNRTRESEWSKRVDEDFPWTVNYPNASATELEVRSAGFIENPTAYRVFFYEHIIPKQDHEGQARMKRDVASRFTVTKFYEHTDLSNLLRTHILNALKEDFLAVEKSNWTDDEYHESFRREKSRIYCGRTDVKSTVQMKFTITNAMNVPILLCGEAGIGKSATLADINNHLLKTEPSAVVVSHYVDCCPTNPDSSSSVVLRLVRKISERLQKEMIKGKKGYETLLTQMVDIGELSALCSMIGESARDTRFYILIDNVTKLVNVRPGSNDKDRWLPYGLAPNVQLILTSTVDIPFMDVIKLDPLPQPVIEDIVTITTQMNSKNIDRSWCHQISLCKPLGNPSVLQLFISELLSFGSYEDLGTKIEDMATEDSRESLIQLIVKDWRDHYSKKIVESSLVIYFLTQHGLNGEVVESFFRQEMGNAFPISKWEAFYALLARNYLSRSGGSRYRLDNPLLRKYVETELLEKVARQDMGWVDFLKLAVPNIKVLHNRDPDAAGSLVLDASLAFMESIRIATHNRAQRITDYKAFLISPLTIKYLLRKEAIFQKTLVQYKKLDPDANILADSIEASAESAVYLDDYFCRNGAKERIFECLQRWERRIGEIDSIEVKNALIEKLKQHYNEQGQMKELSTWKVAKEAEPAAKTNPLSTVIAQATKADAVNYRLLTVSIARPES